MISKNEFYALRARLVLRRNCPKNPFRMKIHASVIPCVRNLTTGRVKDLVPMQHDDVRAGDPASRVRVAEDLVGAVAGVVTQRKQVVELEELLEVELELADVGRAVGELHAPGGELGRPGTRILRVDPALKVRRAGAGEDGERGGDAVRPVLLLGTKDAVAEEHVVAGGPEAAVRVVGHRCRGGAQVVMGYGEADDASA